MIDDEIAQQKCTSEVEETREIKKINIRRLTNINCHIQNKHNQERRKNSARIDRKCKKRVSSGGDGGKEEENSDKKKSLMHAYYRALQLDQI